jgi:hypothetical protein
MRNPASGMSDKTRTGLLALAVAFSAGIHAALVPEHLQEMRPLGYSFIAAAAIGAAIAVALVSRPGSRRLAAVAGLFCLGQIAAWGLFVTVRVPLFSGTPEPVEAIALVSKAVEAVAIVLALQLVGFGRALGAFIGARSYPHHVRGLENP